MRKYLLLFLLGGCTPHMLYSPDLAGTPTDKYYTDVDSCKRTLLTVHDTVEGAFDSGWLWQRPKAYNKIDDCLRKKGYTIKKSS